MYDAAIAAIEDKEKEYKLIEGNKKELDGYISSERMLYLFAAGIAIQVLSLVAPPMIIITIVSFSPAIIIVIRCLLLLLDEIVGEEEQKKENA